MYNTLDDLYQDLGQAKPFFLIAGPCVVEAESLMLQTAETLKELCLRLKVPLVFKSSYAKANRSSAGSPTGPGAAAGLKILEKIKRQFDLPILSDVHEGNEVQAASEVCDVLQIPAFLSRQTSLIVAAAATGKIINIKKGQFMAPEDMKGAADKATATGNTKLLLTERGSSFGYHNLVVDFRSFAILRSLQYPVVYDVTHSLQRPSQSAISGGDPQFAPMMAKAALATGCVQGLFIETHPDPAKAQSDSNTQLPLHQLEALLRECIAVTRNLR